MEEEGVTSTSTSFRGVAQRISQMRAVQSGQDPLARAAATVPATAGFQAVARPARVIPPEPPRLEAALLGSAPPPSPIEEQYEAEFMPPPTPPRQRPLSFCEAPNGDPGVVDNLTLLLRQKQKRKRGSAVAAGKPGENPFEKMLANNGFVSLEQVLGEPDEVEEYGESSCGEEEDDDSDSDEESANGEMTDEEEDEDYLPAATQRAKQQQQAVSHRFSSKGIPSSTLHKKRLPSDGKREEDGDEEPSPPSSPDPHNDGGQPPPPPKKRPTTAKPGKLRPGECFGCMFDTAQDVEINLNEFKRCLDIIRENLGRVKLICVARLAHLQFKHKVYRPGMHMWRTLEIMDHIMHTLDPAVFLALEIIEKRKEIRVYKKMRLIKRADEQGNERVEVYPYGMKLYESTLKQLRELYAMNVEKMNFYDKEHSLSLKELSQLATSNKNYER